MKGVTLVAILLAVIAIPAVNASPADSLHAANPDTIITVDSTNLRFSPSTVTIEEGDAVRFFWDGQLLPHNAVEENETFDSGDTKSDEDYRFVFTQGLNGTFEYYCEPHRNLGMIGQIIVNPAPVVMENNSTTEELVIEDEDEDDSFMPFLSFHAITIAIMVAALIRTKED
mgnify:CR=1 FL=1